MNKELTYEEKISLLPDYKRVWALNKIKQIEDLNVAVPYRMIYETALTIKTPNDN